ncbi:MAG: DUF2142 domain-containing protein [Erysipelotrichaceae bacterium]
MEKIVNRVKENLKKNKVLLGIFLVIWIVLICVTLGYYDKTLGRESDGAAIATEVIEINENTIVEQSIEIPEGSKTISIKYATYARKNKGNIYIKVTGNKTNTLYLDTKTNISMVQDNAFVTYELLEEAKGETVTLVLTSDSLEGKAAGVYFTNEPYFGGELIINDEKSDFELDVRYLSERDDYKALSTTVITFGVIAFSILILVMLLLDVKAEVLFTSMVAIYGLILIVIMSPGANPDEGLHYEQTLQVSNVILREENPYVIDEAYVNYDSFGDHTNTSYSYNRLLRDFNKPFELSGKLHEFDPTIEGMYTGYYIPQLVGVMAMRLINAPMLHIFYAGRLTNLIFYSICVYIALKNAKSHKLLLGVIATLPIFVQQGASYSYDASVNGFILISISFLLKWLKQDEQISRKDFIIVFITCMLLAPAKVVYGLFPLLYFFVPYTKFGSKKKKYLLTVLLCLPSVCLIGYQVLLRTWDIIANMLAGESNNVLTLGNGNIFFEGDEGNKPLAKLYTITYMLENPAETIMIYIRSIRMWLSTWFYQSLGRGLAGVTLILPMTVIRIILVLIIVSILQADNYAMNWKMRLSTVVICVAIAMLVLTTMLTGWTRRDDIYIQGMQGRYFCPLLPYFFSIFSNKKIKIKYNCEKPVIFTIICLMFFITVFILSYTFVN